MNETSLVFKDTVIRDRDEKLNLTDMWRAAGSDPSKRPADWARKEGASFIRFVAGMLNMPHGHIEKSAENDGSEPGLFRVERGGRDPGTWAHWKIGMAYAEYLSEEIHSWFLDVVRAHMEGRGIPVAAGVAVATAPMMTMAQIEAMASRIVDPITRRMDENFERTWGKQEKTEAKVNAIEAEMQVNSKKTEARFQHLESLVASKRREVSARTVRLHCAALREQGGLCPCCRKARVVDDFGQRIAGDDKQPLSDCDHFHSNARPAPTETWLICKGCHHKLTHEPGARDAVVPAFMAYQHAARSVLSPKVEQGKLFS